MKSLRFMVPLLVFMGLVVFFFKGLSIDPREIPSPLIGKPLPHFSLPSLAEPQKPVSEQDLQGKVALLNVWATWCVSCRAEHEVLVQLARSQTLDIYSLNWKDDPAAARDWLRRLGDPYVTTIVDQEGRTAIDLGVYGAPETFLIDKAGVIRYKHAGPLTWPLLREKIIPLANELKAKG